MSIYPTTEAAIVTHMREVIRLLGPEFDAGEPFKPYDTENDENEDAFRRWCEDNVGACYRWFDVRSMGDSKTPSASSVYIEERECMIRIMVAYPQTGRFGDDQALARHKVMEADRARIERATGMVGVANFSDPNPDASCLETVTDPRLEGAGVDFLVMTHRMIYVRQYDA